ncbi:unnamed protein product [Protopolystoma xenopodis]|uniref:Uncharacterized protein n=1 Tax=Protopolystoma xenopodis TaxID=117903 RepID=A0A448WL41_9PLAT|nr:unnamed protein product [Protopolystoma xenopodis]
MPRLVVKDMEQLYIEEVRKMIGELMIRLEAVPVTKGASGFQKFKKYNRSGQMIMSSPGSLLKDSTDESSELNLNKLDIQLNFTIEVNAFG